MAAAVAFTQATRRIHTVTDSEYVRSGIIALRCGGELQAEACNLDKWWRIGQQIHKVHRVACVKGQRTKQQTTQLGIAEEDRQGNARADDLATKGLRMHEEDEDTVKLYAARRATLKEIHRRILKQQTWLADRKALTFGEEG